MRRKKDNLRALVSAFPDGSTSWNPAHAEHLNIHENHIRRLIHRLQTSFSMFEKTDLATLIFKVEFRRHHGRWVIIVHHKKF